MANKRQLKKQIHYICGDIAAECAMALDAIPGIDVEKMAQNIRDIAQLQVTTLANISFSFDKTPSDFESRREYNLAHSAYNKAAFHRLRIEFNEALQAIVHNMNASLPAKK